LIIIVLVLILVILVHVRISSYIVTIPGTNINMN